jgi:hypothetical protein
MARSCSYRGPLTKLTSLWRTEKASVPRCSPAVDIEVVARSSRSCPVRVLRVSEATPMTSRRIAVRVIAIRKRTEVCAPMQLPSSFSDRMGDLQPVMKSGPAAARRRSVNSTASLDVPLGLRSAKWLPRHPAGGPCRICPEWQRSRWRAMPARRRKRVSDA